MKIEHFIVILRDAHSVSIGSEPFLDLMMIPAPALVLVKLKQLSLVVTKGI